MSSIDRWIEYFESEEHAQLELEHQEAKARVRAGGETTTVDDQAQPVQTP